MRRALTTLAALVLVSPALALVPATAACASQPPVTEEEQMELQQLPMLVSGSQDRADLDGVLSARLVAMDRSTGLTFRDPRLAAALDIAPAAALGALGLAIHPLVAVAMPLTVGLGQFYAGDAARAGWVTLGSSAAFLAGGAAGGGLQLALGAGSPWSGAVAGGLSACGLYAMWAGQDAFQLSQRRNQSVEAARP